MDELFEALTLIQTGKVKHFPVVLMGRDYWKGLVEWMGQVVARHRNIDTDDLKMFQVTDDPAEATRIIIDAQRRMVRASGTHGRIFRG
jgi:predicted Rossmann-fold nucleotide-binding protein